MFAELIKQCSLKHVCSRIARHCKYRMADLKKFSKAEVAGRNGRNGAPTWVIIKDIVYDVTSYLKEHPGGDDAIAGHAGKDATRDFEEVGHSVDARAVLKKFRIGEIVEEEKVYDANGKKKKKVVESQPKTGSRSFISIICCGLLG